MLAMLAGAFSTSSGLADPAANPTAVPPSVNQITAGAITTPTAVPDGVCVLRAVVTGGAGASNQAATNGTGQGGGGAKIDATFKVLPLQSFSGMVGAGGVADATFAGTSSGGAGTTPGGNGGTITPPNTTYHRGGGGGGSSSISVAGVKLIEAGAGGGGGAAHQAAGNGGGGGSGGLAAGGVAAGSSGAAGSQGSGTVGAGQGGQAAAYGTGGTNSRSNIPGSTPPNYNWNGSAGTVAGGGTGGKDNSIDSGGGGGGGYTGGGGGAATEGDGNTGGGGGGGSSYLVAKSPVTPAVAVAPTLNSAITNANTGTGILAGAAGSIAATWVPCVYTLSVSKSASPTSVNAGAKTVWTVTVKNVGSDPMTRGDTLVLTDLLPGPVSTAVTKYKVTNISTNLTTDANLATGALTCIDTAGGGTISNGSVMPPSLTCTRPYDASTALGSPSGGSRGLNANETLTISYEQVFPNTAACATITNTASVKDRDATGVVFTKSASANVTINCYDLAITKSVSPTSAGAGNTLTWTVNVTNNGPADMMGPDDTNSNPLIVTDTEPTTNVSAPTLFTSSGPAGACTYASPTITCPSGLASGQTQTFTFQQTISVSAPTGTVISNSASVVDPKASDTNDNATASVTTQATLTLLKAWGVNSIATDVASIGATTGGASNTTAFTATGGVAASSNTVNIAVGNTITFPAETFTTGIAANYGTVLSCTAGGGATANALSGTNGQVAGNKLVIGAGDAGKAIVCTYKNTRKSATLTLRKTWANALSGETATVTAASFINTASSGPSTSTGNNTTTGTAAIVYAGESSVISETGSNLANYTATLACSGNSNVLVGSTLTIAPADTAITCTQTNTRKSTTFRLAKAWGANSISNDKASIGATTGLATNTVLFTSTASTNTNGAFVTVFAGEVATLPAETMTVGTLANYGTVVSCSAGTLTGNDGQLSTNTLTVTPAATAAAITCTYTNTRKSASLTLRKSWVAGAAGDTATVTSSGFISAASSGPSTSSGNNTTTGTAITVYAAEVGSFSETGSNLAAYGASLACTGNSIALTGSSLTIAPSDTAITCTITNTKLPTLTLTKISNGGVGEFSFAGVAPDANGWTSQTITTVTSGVGVVGATQTLAAASTATTIKEAIPVGYYVTAITCAGLGSGGSYTPTLSTGTLAFNAAATAPGSNITCTFNNGIPSFTVAKAVSAASVSTPSTLTYTISVQNTSTVGLTGVSVTDALLQGASSLTLTFGPTFASGDTSNVGMLDVGETWVYTATYAVKQANIDNGATLSNTATAGVTQVAGTVTSPAATTTITRTPALTLLKTSSTPGPVVVGQVITYTFKVTNSGNVTANDVIVTDSPFNGHGSPPVPSSESQFTDAAPFGDSSDATSNNGTWSVLAPGDVVTYTGTYTVTQADIDNLQ
jgi:trimeric autotransporter adhesin